MQVQFAFKHMKSSQALRSYTEDKLLPIISRYVTKPVETRVTFSVDKQRYSASCVLRGGDGFSVQVEHVGDEMYRAVDCMLDKFKTQLKRVKEKLKDHRPQVEYIEIEEESEQDQE